MILVCSVTNLRGFLTIYQLEHEKTLVMTDLNCADKGLVILNKNFGMFIVSIIDIIFILYFS